MTETETRDSRSLSLSLSLYLYLSRYLSLSLSLSLSISLVISLSLSHTQDLERGQRGREVRDGDRDSRRAQRPRIVRQALREPVSRYSFRFKNNCFAEMRSGSGEGSYLRLVDFCITQL